MNLVPFWTTRNNDGETLRIAPRHNPDQFLSDVFALATYLPGVIAKQTPSSVFQRQFFKTADVEFTDWQTIWTKS